MFGIITGGFGACSVGCICSCVSCIKLSLSGGNAVGLTGTRVGFCVRMGCLVFSLLPMLM